MKECPYNHSFIHEQHLQNGILQIMDLNKWMKFTNSYYLTGKIYYNGTGCNCNFFHTPDEFLKICNNTLINIIPANEFIIWFNEEILK